MHNKILQMIKDQHQSKLDIHEEVYYLVLKDAVISVYYNEDEKQIKVNIEQTPQDKTFVYFNQKVSLEDLF